MSTLEDLDDLERHEKEEKKDDGKKDGDKEGKKADGDAEMKDAEPEEEQLDEEILSSSTRDIVARKRLLENDMRIMKSEFQRLTHEKASMNEKIKDNLEKIENNRCGPSVPAVGPAARQQIAA
jgi:26S proteasome regulatory subunit T5